MNDAIRAQIFARLAAANPKPVTELNYASPFQLLIAVMLSAQATDVSVNKATQELFKIAPTAHRMLDLGEEKLQPIIRHIGLYRGKTKNILATCRLLIDRYRGEVPADREALENLPGVGRKTANVVLNTAFAQPVIAVDTHIFRVANRSGLAPGKTPLIVEQILSETVPEDYKRNAHHWLVLHGRYVCKARQPDCSNCLIADLCEFAGKG